jgi:hypothetical protein
VLGDAFSRSETTPAAVNAPNGGDLASSTAMVLAADR